MALLYHNRTSVQELVRSQEYKEPSVQELVHGREHKEKTILIVEDDEDLGELILEALQQENFYTGINYRTLLAIDGMDALKIVEETLPDLFLLDYYLPRMNGLDLYDRLHAIETLAHVPTIFMSANPPFKELMKRNLLSMRKPFNLRELLHIIERLLTEQKNV
jgi:CheY-like chemotaxis protein